MDTLGIKLIGRIDGEATLNLLDAAKKIVSTLKLTTEQEEVYELSFKGLENLSPGNYTLQYNDGTNIKNLQVTRQAITERSTELIKGPVITIEAQQ